MCLSLLGQLLSLIFTLIYVVATALPKKKKLLITAAFSAMILAGECLKIVDFNPCWIQTGNLKKNSAFTQNQNHISLLYCFHPSSNI